MAKPNQLKSGIILSYVNQALGMIIPFVYTPLMLSMLGQQEYGLYSLSSSVVGYLSLLSFGFGATVVRYISKYRAEGNKEALERTYGFFLMLYAVMAIAVFLMGLVLSGNVEPIFEKGLTLDEQSKMQILVIIMAASSALAFPASVVSSVIISHERFIYRQALNIFTTVIGPVSNLVFLFLGYKSIGMSLASLVVQAIVIPTDIFYLTKVLHIRPRFGRLEPGIIKEMVKVSFYNFLATIVDMLFWSTDKVILGMLTSTTMVAIYNVGAHFNNMVVKLSSTITSVLAPKVTGMAVRNASSKEYTDLFIKIGRVQFFIIGLVMTGFIAFGQQFLDVWVGEEYRRAYSIALFTLLPLSIPLIQNTGITILVAQNKQGFRSIVYSVIAVANALSTWFAVQYLASINHQEWGGFAAAFCSCVSYVIGQGFIMNWYYHKKIKINIPLFWGNILKMAIIPVTMCVITLVLTRITKWICITNWATLFVGVGIYTALYITLMYKLILNDYEKDLVRKPVRAVARKLKIRK